MRTETEVLEKKKNAIQAGLFLAREGLFMNSPDVEQTVTQANNGAISCVTYSTSSNNNAPIFGVTELDPKNWTGS